MAVYVDNAIFPWRGRRWAHLMADDLDELHAFAARLGIPRYKFQDRRSGAHYDIDADMRATALRLGAIAVSRTRERARLRAIIANARRQWSGHAARTATDAATLATIATAATTITTTAPEAGADPGPHGDPPCPPST